MWSSSFIPILSQNVVRFTRPLADMGLCLMFCSHNSKQTLHYAQICLTTHFIILSLHLTLFPLPVFLLSTHLYILSRLSFPYTFFPYATILHFPDIKNPSPAPVTSFFLLLSTTHLPLLYTKVSWTIQVPHQLQIYYFTPDNILQAAVNLLTCPYPLRYCKIHSSIIKSNTWTF